MNGYLDQDFEPPSPTEDFAGFYRFLPQSPEWVAEKISAAKLAERLSESQMHELVGYLRTGLVRAYSSHAYVQYRLDEDKTFSSVKELISWLSKWRYGGREEAFHGWFQIPQTFWLNAHANNTDWAGSTITPFCEAAFADWSIGKFGAIYDRFESEPQIEIEQRGYTKTVTGQTVFFAVQFQSADIDATFGSIGGQTATRASTYDWEAAFADVAAELYHNVEITNLEARGVQAEVINLLRSSFETRRVAVPSDDTLKPKARKFLGALRGKKPKKPE